MRRIRSADFRPAYTRLSPAELEARVRQGLAEIPGVRFPHPTEINFVLAALPKPVWDGLVADGSGRLFV